MIERRIVNLRGEGTRAESRIVPFVQTCATVDQESSRRWLIRPYALHQGRFAIAVRHVDRNRTIKQFLDFDRAASCSGGAKLIEDQVTSRFANWLGRICHRGRCQSERWSRRCCDG